ncbi:hypothetical protein, partial [Staphylococcus aureus]|uniref:hypothetical protein n=1 Tax=Staphylococcus aureus TaxID=1280 RepID=UPI0038B37C26
MTVQVLHSSDVAKAYATAAIGEQQGAFNLAADPPVTMETIAEVLGARLVNVPQQLIRSGVWAAWHA